MFLRLLLGITPPVKPETKETKTNKKNAVTLINQPRQLLQFQIEFCAQEDIVALFQTNRHLRDTLKAYFTHLDLIPTQVHLTCFKINYLTFQSNPDLMDNIKRINALRREIDRYSYPNYTNTPRLTMIALPNLAKRIPKLKAKLPDYQVEMKQKMTELQTEVATYERYQQAETTKSAHIELLKQRAFKHAKAKEKKEDKTTPTEPASSKKRV